MYCTPPPLSTTSSFQAHLQSISTLFSIWLFFLNRPGWYFLCLLPRSALLHSAPAPPRPDLHVNFLSRPHLLKIRFLQLSPFSAEVLHLWVPAGAESQKNPSGLSPDFNSKTLYDTNSLLTTANKQPQMAGAHIWSGHWQPSSCQLPSGQWFKLATFRLLVLLFNLWTSHRPSCPSFIFQNPHQYWEQKSALQWSQETANYHPFSSIFFSSFQHFSLTDQFNNFRFVLETSCEKAPYPQLCWSKRRTVGDCFIIRTADPHITLDSLVRNRNSLEFCLCTGVRNKISKETKKKDDRKITKKKNKREKESAIPRGPLTAQWLTSEHSNYVGLWGQFCIDLQQQTEK